MLEAMLISIGVNPTLARDLPFMTLGCKFLAASQKIGCLCTSVSKEVPVARTMSPATGSVTLVQRISSQLIEDISDRGTKR